MRQRLALILLLVPALSGCARSAGLFSEQNARAHVEMLAGTIGSRRAGTEGNARARAYLVDQLKLYGFDVRVQEADARRATIGLTAHVSNIIASLPGSRREAIGLLSHYDSVPDGPGAADDGFGVAVCLEAARVLATRTERQWTTFVLITDAEEVGLMGAAALMTDRDVTSRLQAYINVEAAGSGGSAMLFEAGPANGWILAPWARRAPHPRGASFGVEIYKRLPNDTDFSIVARQGIPGLNFAMVGDGYAYHTARDTADRLSLKTLRETGENVVSVAAALDRIDITQRSTWAATYFDIGGTTALSYSAIIGWLIAATALLFGAMAWVKVTAAALRIGGAWRWVLTAVWAAVGATLTVAAMAGVTWGLRAAREVYHPWYARPNRLFVLLLATGIATAWTISRAGALLPARAHGMRHPAVTWSVTLPVWIVMAGAALWLAPGAAYLLTLPLLTAGVLLLLAPAANDAAVRLVSVVILAVTATLWLQNTLDLLRFIVALFGRLPVITPAFVYAGVMSAAAALIVPPFVAAVATARPLMRPSFVTALCLLAVAIAAGFAYAAPAYTYEQPLRRHVRALQEADGTGALWEVASVEPGLDLAAGAPGGWTPQSGPASTSVPWGRFAFPFVFRTTGPALGAPPIDIAGFSLQPVDAGTELRLAVVPKRAGLAVSFILPPGITPARSSLPGVERYGRWTATFIAPPPDGIAWRASFSGPAERLRDVRVVATDSGFPDGTGPQRLPAWLPQERAVWNAAATWVVPAGALRPIEPVPPLR